MKMRLLPWILFTAIVAHAQIIWEFPQATPIGTADIAAVITLRRVTYVYGPPEILPPIWVQPGTKVRLQLGPWAQAGEAFQWTHNRERIAKTGTVLELNNVTAADAGDYIAMFTRPPADPMGYPDFATSEMITLRVGYPPRRSLANVSTLARISAAQPSFTTGVVVPANADGGPTTFLLRAVGPGLARFVSDPLAAPQLKVFDASGTDLSAPGVVSIVAGGDPLADAAQRVGAFPLPAGSKDAVELRSLLPGNYTVQVSSSASGTGAVLLEVYEVP